MKYKILLFLPTALSCLISAYIIWMGLIGSPRINRTYLLIELIFIISLNLIYFLWLAITKRIGRILSILYIPIAFILLVIFFIAIPNQFWLIKTVKLDMGPDPFYIDQSATIGANYKFGIWEKGYWSEAAREEVRLERLNQMQTARQGSLIGHIGSDLQGWSTERIRFAFGEPAKIIKEDENLEKWIYHPWTNHPDWEMPVYVQDGLLLKIGD